MDSFATPKEEHSKFKASGYGKWLLLSLFFETSLNKDNVLYTLKDYPIKRGGKTYQSLKQLYLAMEDVTEYSFANTYLGGWAHWKELCSSPKLSEHIEEWREELELKLRSRGMKAMIKKASEERGTAAAEYLIEKKWDKKRGRPSKQEKAQEAKKQSQLTSRYSDDLSRISKLKKVK